MDSSFRFHGQPLPNPFPGEYRFDRELGSGAFGTVWEAHDLNLDIAVALKTINLPHTDPRAEEVLDRLRSEAQLAARVRHPNVVQVRTWRDTETRDFRHYLVMDYVGGGSLLARLRKDGIIHWESAVRYAADTGEALAAVHARGIVHRDVKPANILWDEDADEARLTDFGVSARLSARPGDVAGTASYMSPEAFDGVTEPPVDVYALAATLYHLVAGEPPFEAFPDGSHRPAIRRGLPTAAPRLAVVPESVEVLIRAGLHHDPAARPPLPEFVAGLRGALNRALADTVVRPKPEAEVSVVGPVRIAVDRFDGRAYQSVASSFRAGAPGAVVRDLTKVPPPPRTADLRTGDRVRIRGVLDRDGYLTVFSVGPTGNLNLLYPDDPAAPTRHTAGETVDIGEAELKPPIGRERVFAFWSRTPLPLGPDDLRSLAATPLATPSDDPAANVTRGYRATRDMTKVRTSLQTLPPGDWHAVGLELDHRAR